MDLAVGSTSSTYCMLLCSVDVLSDMYILQVAYFNELGVLVVLTTAQIPQSNMELCIFNMILNADEGYTFDLL